MHRPERIKKLVTQNTDANREALSAAGRKGAEVTNAKRVAAEAEEALWEHVREDVIAADMADTATERRDDLIPEDDR